MRSDIDLKTRQLVALAKDGDGSALNQLYALYGERVRWMMRLRMGKELRSKLESMDLAQEVLLRTLKGLGTFKYENEGDFTRWLARVADNTFRDELDRLHAGKRDIRKERPLDDRGLMGRTGLPGSPPGLSATTPSEIMSKKEDLARLERAMDTLKAEHREVIVLAKLEGLPYSEIADRLGKSVDAVKMLVSRAVVALAKAYGSA